MIVTIEEAKKKFCPFGRKNGGQGSYNMTTDRNGNHEIHTFCVGPRCMMWVVDGTDENLKHGYCGLAA